MVAYIHAILVSVLSPHQRSPDLFLIGMEIFDCKGLFEIKI